MTTRRIAGALALAAGLAAGAASASAGEPAAAGGAGEERGLEDVLAELDAQRAEIDALRTRLAVQEGDGSVEEAVRKYLESEEGRKLLGREKSEFRVSWKDGLTFETEDKEFSLKVGGRVQFDMVFPDADEDLETAVGDFDPRAGLRRARIEMGGTVHGNVYYKLAVEFAGAQGITDNTGSTSSSVGSYQFRDAHVGYRGIPLLGSFQVGQFKEPVGLEEMTSDNFVTFTERSLANDAFAPNYDVGAMVLGSAAGDRIHWAAGDFMDNNGGLGDAPIQHNLAGRLAGLPVYDKEAKTLLHLGASFQTRSPEAEQDRFRVRPSAAFLPRTLDTGNISVDTEDVLGLEFAVAWRSISLQAERYRARIEGHPDVAGAPSPAFSGYYVAASWFVTGENRPYRGGGFARVKPESNFKGKSGTGALELAARYAALDLDDDGVTGGTAHDWTFGANWHLNPNARVMVNWVLHELHRVGGVNTLVVRFQIDF